MKKFIFSFIKFIFFTAIFYSFALLFSAIYLPNNLRPNLKFGREENMSLRMMEIKNKKNIDILFIGSSHTYRGFDTRIFKKKGFNTFNLGSKAQTHLQTEVLLNRYLNTLNPKTIIYEVYPKIFKFNNGLESAYDIITNDKNDLNSFKMVLKINDINIYNTFIYSFTSDLLNLKKPIPTTLEYQKYISGGFVEKEINFYKPTLFEKNEIIVNPRQLECFSKNVEMIKNKNIKLILIFAPISKVEYNSYTNTNYFDSLMKKHSDYYNFNKIISLNDSLHFYDSHHLNQNGVNTFNKKLIELLIKNNPLTTYKHN